MKPSTNLPWAYGHLGLSQSFWIGKDHAASPVAIIDEVSGGERENAAFIVAACNAYPRLVEALWKIRMELAALVSNPDNPDWMPALTAGNPADATCLQKAYDLTAERGKE